MTNVLVTDANGNDVPVDVAALPSGDNRQILAVGSPTTDAEVAEVHNGALAVQQSPATTTTSTYVTASTTEMRLLAAGTRLGVTVHNDSTNVLTLYCGTDVITATRFTVRVPADGYYEAPYGYQGAVRGVWSGTGGGAAITQFGA